MDVHCDGSAYASSGSTGDANDAFSTKFRSDATQDGGGWDVGVAAADPDAGVEPDGAVVGFATADPDAGGEPAGVVGFAVVGVEPAAAEPDAGVEPEPAGVIGFAAAGVEPAGADGGVFGLDLSGAFDVDDTRKYMTAPTIASSDTPMIALKIRSAWLDTAVVTVLPSGCVGRPP